MTEQNLKTNAHSNIIQKIIDTAYTFGDPAARDADFVFKKLVEETGEYARAVNQPERCDEPFYSEAADVVITLIDHLLVECCKQGLDAQVLLNQAVDKKLERWRQRMLGA